MFVHDRQKYVADDYRLSNDAVSAVYFKEPRVPFSDKTFLAKPSPSVMKPGRSSSARVVQCGKMEVEHRFSHSSRDAIVRNKSFNRERRSDDLRSLGISSNNRHRFDIGFDGTGQRVTVLDHKATRLQDVRAIPQRPSQTEFKPYSRPSQAGGDAASNCFRDGLEGT